MDKKYELLKVNNICYRVKALKDFTLITGEQIKKGDIGGYILSEDCLSQEGNCWIMDNSIVYGTVSGNAVIKDFAKVYGDVCGNAIVKDDGFVGTNTTVTDNAVVQTWQRIRYGTVTTDLLGTKDWAGALYAEFGIVPEDGKVILYKRVFKTKFKNVFKSVYNDDFHYLIGKKAIETDVDEDVMNECGKGLHFTSLEFISFHIGNTIIECEVALEDIITVQNGKVRARKCKVIRKFIRKS
jgi:hypothetical protein